MEPRGASCGWCGATHLSANSSASLRVRWCTAALLTSYENVGNTCGVMPGGAESVGTSYENVGNTCGVMPGGTESVGTSYENVGNTCGVMPGGTESVGLQAQGCPLAIHRLQVIIEASGEGCLN
jgi:hypothetical protein